VRAIHVVRLQTVYHQHGVGAVDVDVELAMANGSGRRGFHDVAGIELNVGMPENIPHVLGIGRKEPPAAVNVQRNHALVIGAGSGRNW
jgi:hypothetical protein